MADPNEARMPGILGVARTTVALSMLFHLEEVFFACVAPLLINGEALG